MPLYIIHMRKLLEILKSDSDLPRSDKNYFSMLKPAKTPQSVQNWPLLKLATAAEGNSQVIAYVEVSLEVVRVDPKGRHLVPDRGSPSVACHDQACDQPSPLRYPLHTGRDQSTNEREGGRHSVKARRKTEGVS